MTDSSRVRGTIRDQAGVLSRTQALSAGLTRRQVDESLRSGEWLRVHPGVYRSALVLPTPEASLRAVSLWLGETSVLTGWGAAWWWGLVDSPPTTWHFVVNGQSHLSPQRGVRVSRSFVDPYDRTVRLGVPVLSRPLAALRGAAHRERLWPGEGIKLIDRVKQRRLVSVAELEAAYARNRCTWGGRAMRRLLDRTGDRAHSELERAGGTILRAAGITCFEPNRVVVLSTGRTVELDLADARRKIAIEFDGYAYHSDPYRHRADLRRQNELLADGWTIRRFTWDDVLTDPEGFVRAVRQLLAQ